MATLIATLEKIEQLGFPLHRLGELVYSYLDGDYPRFLDAAPKRLRSGDLKGLLRALHDVSPPFSFISTEVGGAIDAFRVSVREEKGVDELAKEWEELERKLDQLERELRSWLQERSLARSEVPETKPPASSLDERPA